MAEGEVGKAVRAGAKAAVRAVEIARAAAEKEPSTSETYPKTEPSNRQPIARWARAPRREREAQWVPGPGRAPVKRTPAAIETGVEIEARGAVEVKVVVGVKVAGAVKIAIGDPEAGADEHDSGAGEVADAEGA